jgi:heat shock protein HtpX
MCIDNPREGFSNVFDTHPPIDARVAALVKFAGGHDPGPLALPQPPTDPQSADDEANVDQPSPTGPWGSPPPGAEGAQQPLPQGAKPFLPSRPPIELGGTSSGDGGSEPGPWGPHRN